MPDESFRAALAAAVELLAALPGTRAGVREAREQVRTLAAEHPAAGIELAVTLAPGSDDAEYDVLLAHPAGGTVAVAHRRDGGNPWFVQYADHWAADLVVSVGEATVGVRQALAMLELRGDESPSLLDDLVAVALAEEAMEVDRPPVAPEEAQAAADAFRAARGLHSAAATRGWLARMGWTPQLFTSLIENAVRFRKLEERVTADVLTAFLADRRSELDLVLFARVDSGSSDAIARVAALAPERGLLAAASLLATQSPALDITATLATVRNYELAPALSAAEVGEIVGPVAAGGRHWLGEVLVRRAAPADAAARAAARDLLFRRWVDERRAAREVRWHWL